MKLLKNTLFEFKKVSIYFYIFFAIFFLMSLSFFFADSYQPAESVHLNFTDDVKSGITLENLLICGVVGFILLSLMSVLMIIKLFSSEIKEKTLSNSLTLPLSRYEIIISKVLVPIISIFSILIIAAFLETIALITYQFGTDHGFGFFYMVMILNYLNFIMIMFLVTFIYFLIYMFISNLTLATWILTGIFIIFAVSFLTGYIYETIGKEYGEENKFFELCNTFSFIGPYLFHNTNLFFEEGIDPNTSGDHLIFSIVTNNFTDNAWKIPILLILTSGSGILTIWRFPRMNFAF